MLIPSPPLLKLGNSPQILLLEGKIVTVKYCAQLSRFDQFIFNIITLETLEKCDRIFTCIIAFFTHFLYFFA